MMKTNVVLIVFLVLMAVMIVLALTFPEQIERLLNRPSLYPHLLFAHMISVALFFANAVIGILWEARSLTSSRAPIILHTYDTVAWLDARFSSPLIILSLISGIMLTIILGGMREIGWLSLAFLLFVLSGVVWVAGDIPTQYKIKKLIANVDPDAESLPEALMRLLRMRLWISMAGVVPLVAVFILMVYKPPIPAIF